MGKTVFLINSMDMGGAERVLSEIVPSLLKTEDVKILTLKKGNFYSEKVKCESLSNIKNNTLMFLLAPYYIYKVKKISKTSKIISFLEYSNFINISANKNAIISFRTSVQFFRGIKGTIYKFLIKHQYPKAKLIIVNSKENKKELEKYLGVTPSKIFVIPNSVDEINITNNVKIKNNKDKKNDNKLKFVSVGRLHKLKNYDVMINGFSKLVEKNNKYTLSIIGDGPERKNLEKLVKKLKMTNNITFLGSQKNVLKLLKEYDYFLFSSAAEGFPNVLIEAVVAGLPLITSDFKTGAREIIDPDLDFDKTLKYPKFCPNGALLSVKNYDSDLINAWQNKDKITQNKKGIERFYKKNTLPLWKKLIK